MVKNFKILDIILNLELIIKKKLDKIIKILNYLIKCTINNFLNRI